MMQRHMPIGYKLVEGKIQFDEPKAAAVKKVFADYLSGTSTHAIAKQLTQMGFMNASDKASWNHGSIGKILENVKYLGNEFYPQIIDTRLFEQVQNRRKERCEQLGRSIQPNSQSRKHTFSGKLRCGECGEVYRKYIEHCGRKTEKSLWKCKRYIFKNRVCCLCGFLTDEQIEKAFLDVANRILTKIQILDRKPQKEPVPYNREFHRLDQQIKELEAGGQYSSKELPALLYERAKAFYQSARIDDTDYNTGRMKQAFLGRQPLREFNGELFLTVIKQITVYVDHRLVFEFINGLIMEAEY
ncbi:recombinase family protein [Sinanaerobacter chloroacetimidivorans]|uniref:Recombinase family protein n=1 Tax=Sinanaerobacter chloroacetimidivorans TaxID=2818044 RepID=A0A8J7W2L1_9FIRM|nr:recombinase family protein [Sinanaerobacter chloroacetimidivorans]MBR0599744.1 recombinase family protein [Sinanaerobacter chloroacetimidivorans]